MATSVATTVNGVSGRLAPALKDALLAAFVAFVLLAPLLGMRTTSGPTGLTLNFDFEWVLLRTAIVFAGRLALAMLQRARGGQALPTAGLARIGDAVAARSGWLAAAGLVFAFV